MNNYPDDFRGTNQDQFLAYAQQVDQSIIEDNLDAIASVAEEANALLAHIQRLKDNGTLKSAKQKDLLFIQGVLEDALQDGLGADWNRLTYESASITRAPEFPALFGIKSDKINKSLPFIVSRDEA